MESRQAGVNPRHVSLCKQLKITQILVRDLRYFTLVPSILDTSADKLRPFHLSQQVFWLRSPGRKETINLAWSGNQIEELLIYLVVGSWIESITARHQLIQ